MRFKIAACILLILSVFNFVLGAPVPAQGVREARADAVEEGENVIIVSRKRAPGGNSYERDESDSDTEWWTFSPERLSAIESSSGSHSGIGTQSSSSGGNKSAMLTLGETEVSLDQQGEFKPATTTENQPASSSNTKSVSWGTSNKVVLPSGENPYEGEESDSDAEWWTFSPERLSRIESSSGSHSGIGTLSSSPGGNKSSMLTPGWTEVSLDQQGPFKPGTPTEDQPASSSKTKSVSWGTSNKVVLPSGEITSELLPQNLPLPPGREGYLAKMAGKSSPPPPPKGFVSNIKTYYGKLRTTFQHAVSHSFQHVVSHLKTVFEKLGKLDFRPRFQREVDA